MPATIGTDVFHWIVAGVLNLPSAINTFSCCICFNDEKLINRGRVRVNSSSSSYYLSGILTCDGPFAIGISCESNPPLSYAQLQVCT